MMNTVNKNQKELLAQIQSAIQQNGLLTEEILAYIDSALFPPEPDALTDLITDESDCERDTLLDLVFSPDQAVQESLEPLLESSGFSTADENQVEKGLLLTQIRTPIRLPGNRTLATIPVPEDIKVSYLKRLNITHQLDSRVRSAIEEGVGAKRCLAVKVKMRNSKIHPRPRHRQFLCSFFERMEEKAPGYFQCLDLVLSLLGSAPGEKDVYALLAERKQSLFRSLKQISRFETLLSRSNMETLMLQGIRAPHASRQEVVRQMERVDRICFSVFGKTEIIPEPVEETLKGMDDLMVPR